MYPWIPRLHTSTAMTGCVRSMLRMGWRHAFGQDQGGDWCLEMRIITGVRNTLPPWDRNHTFKNKSSIQPRLFFRFKHPKQKFELKIIKLLFSKILRALPGMCIQRSLNCTSLLTSDGARIGDKVQENIHCKGCHRFKRINVCDLLL